MNLHVRNMPHLHVFSTGDQSLLPRTPNSIFTRTSEVWGKQLDLPKAGGDPAPRCAHGAGRLLLPKEHALPKAIVCHNSPALRPWVNICARCLFELLQSRYLPQNTPRAN